VAFDPQRHYPLGTERPDLVSTPGGLLLDELSLNAERVESSELRVRPETLRLQADVAAAAGRPELAANLRRAAELAPLADDTILAVYTALRPRRSTPTPGYASRAPSGLANKAGGGPARLSANGTGRVTE